MPPYDVQTMLFMNVTTTSTTLSTYTIWAWGVIFYYTLFILLFLHLSCLSDRLKRSGKSGGTNILHTLFHSIYLLRGTEGLENASFCFFFLTTTPKEGVTHYHISL